MPQSATGRSAQEMERRLHEAEESLKLSRDSACTGQVGVKPA
jgi:hypothetical protein